MPVIDLETRHHLTYLKCLEDWSAEMEEAGPHKTHWYNVYKDRGLRVKTAVDENDNVIGFIQYLPIEESIVNGKDLYFILCVWIHGYKEDIGNHQDHGIGTELLEAAEADVQQLGAKGMAAWGLWHPFWMKASWFKKRGYKAADRMAVSQLVWKPFSDDAKPPVWIHQKKQPKTRPGKVSVAAFLNGWCPAQNVTVERTRRACEEFGDRVVFDEYHTSDRAVFDEWGISDGIFIDGKKQFSDPSPSYEKIVKKIRKRVKRLDQTTTA